MPNIAFGDSLIALNEQETVLDALLRAGHDITNGCRAGSCQSCLLITQDVKLPSAATSGLSESQKSLGVFKSCSLIPTEDITVKTAEDLIHRVSANAIEKSMLNDDVIRIRMKSEFEYKPGQYVSLWKDELVRSYSIASVPQLDNYLEFHIKHYPEGKFSHWVYQDLEEGMELDIQGPLGNCFYTATTEPVDLLLIASGTGLAPLFGIVRDALRLNHQGSIHLLFAGRSESDLYYLNELSQLSEENRQFSFDLITLNQANDDRFIQADIYDYVKQNYPDLKGSRVYICGAASFVKKLKKQCFLSGANMPDIFTDSFITFAS